MRALEELSGPWVGWWVHEGEREPMRLHLRFENGRVTGKGVDRLGGFEVAGTYRPEAVDLVKAYPLYSSRCRGKWDGLAVCGEWRIKSADRHESGPFEMWPEGDGLSIAELVTAQEETLALPGRTGAGD